MKILIANDGPTAFYYIRTGLARAFNTGGHEVMMWDIHKKPVFDMFDEFEPDLFLGQTYNTTPVLVKAIKERPHMKVIMKAGDWGKLSNKIQFPILKASEEEKKIILDLKEETDKPDFLHIHYHPDYVEETHGYWADKGISVHSHMLGADIFDYTNGERMEHLVSNLSFIGGYWSYKAETINKYLIPLCNEKKYTIKIFGNSHWPVVQYCGFLQNEYVKHAMKSADICINLSEPHSQVYGFDIIEKPFKLLSNKCFVISDYVEGLHKLFGENLVMAKTPEEFKKLVDHYLKNPDERQPFIDTGYKEVMNNHTYFHRVRDIFNNLNLEHYGRKTMEIYNKIRISIDESNII